uniref:BED-type domain-containing protein n=1 Tax=Anopheles christyi TaxID=43041 RepID=A0A182JU88_9DIPT
MPNYLKSNAIVWQHFSKDPQEKRGKCFHCGQMISYEKSTLSNLRRHLFRKHQELMNEVDTSSYKYVPVHYVWDHFIKEPEEKAKCVYCQSVLGCPKNVVGNLIRHLKTRHPSLVLEQDRNQEELFETSRTQYIHESIEESLSATTSLQELELQIAELPTIDGSDLPASVKIELVNPYSESSPDVADQEVIEEEIIHESHQDVEIDCEETDSSGHYVDNNHPDEMGASNMIEETDVVTSANNSLSQDDKIQSHEPSRVQDNFFCIGMNDINMKTAIYATNIAMELESLPPRQRIIAEKLMSDVMFHAKLDNLTEFAMILGKVNCPFEN